MKENKTIFITAFHSFITKNILNTDVFSVIKSDPSVQIFLLVPKIKEAFFSDLYVNDRVSVIGVDTNRINNQRWVRIFSKLSKLLIDSHYLEYKKRESLEVNKSLITFFKYLFEISFTKLFAGKQRLQTVFHYFFSRLVSIQEVKDLIATHDPDYLFTTDVFDETDILFANEFRKLNKPVIGMIRSWDNCYSKGLLRVLPDRLIVNNHTLLNEAWNLHGMPPDKIKALGSPQHDIFINSKRTPREIFFKSMNLDSKKKTILFAPAGAILSDTDWQIAEIIKQAMDKGQFIFPAQLLIRNHPNHPADFSSLSGKEGVIIEDPGKVFNVENPKDTELTLADNVHLADELYYSDVVVWVATTLPLDAVIFDKPLISVNFDGYESKPYYRSVQRYHDEDHMKKMLECNGIAIVNSKKELINSINAYFQNPSLNQDGRGAIIKQQFYNLDGKAGRRIGEYILSFLDN